MSTAAAHVFAPVHDPAGEELVRHARARAHARQLEHARRRAHLLTAVPTTAAAAGCALFIHAGPSLSPWRALILVALFAAMCNVRFETGAVYTVPTQLLLVPMLFALPLGLVPAAVVVGFVVGRGHHALRRRDPWRVLAQISNGGHALGPVVVIALAGGLPLRWSAWPVYAGALAAQLGVDLAGSTLYEILTGARPKAVARYSLLVYTTDLALAPVGLCVAFATRGQSELVVLVLPLVLLLRTFSRERKHRIDHALELSDAYRGTAFLLGDVVEADDAYTGDHSRHVVDLVLAVADDLKLDPEDRRVAEFVALLHDVGKIKIPGEIISKPGPLTAEERTIIETHTIEGEKLLEQVGGLLAHVGRVVRSCHEHWDGRGYPDGLAGEEIPLVARIVCACDAFSAMTTDRSYRAARSTQEALAEMRRCAGTQFDPQVVDALCRVAG